MKFSEAYEHGYRIRSVSYDGVCRARNNEGHKKLFRNRDGVELDPTRPGFWRDYAPLGGQQVSGGAVFWALTAVLAAISGALLWVAYL